MPLADVPEYSDRVLVGGDHRAMQPRMTGKTTILGRQLGVVYSEYETIRNGDFRGILLGDYWSDPSGVKWQVVDFNYYYRIDGASNIGPHVVVMPVNILYSTPWNTTDTVEGAYVGSKIRTDGLAYAKTVAERFFGGGIIHYYNLLPNSVNGGMEDGVIRTESYIELPSEIQIFGSRIRNTSGTNTYDTQQFALFRKMSPSYMSNHREFWLRDVCGDEDHTYVGAHSVNGESAKVKPSATLGVRPYFLVH
jgi:hypothetical protein